MEEKYIFFWNPTEEGEEVTKACLSQWYPSYMVIDGQHYWNVEQYLMAEKARLFGDQETLEKIWQTQDPKDIKKFYEIQLETAARQKFVEFSEDFLRKQFEAFAKYDEVKLYTAKLGKDILAQNFMIFYGNECSYHYGVSTELGTKYSGAPLLHMQAMRDARERGIKRYNFWGITALDDTNHRFYGVSQFKRSFGVEELIYLHAHDLVIKPAKYKLNYVFEKTRAKIRHV